MDNGGSGKRVQTTGCNYVQNVRHLDLLPMSYHTPMDVRQPPACLDQPSSLAELFVCEPTVQYMYITWSRTNMPSVIRNVCSRPPEQSFNRRQIGVLWRVGPFMLPSDGHVHRHHCYSCTVTVVP